MATVVKRNAEMPQIDKLVALPLKAAHLDELSAIFRQFKDTPKFNDLQSKYAGPGAGVVWNDAEDKLVIAEGWRVVNGEIVRK